MPQRQEGQQTLKSMDLAQFGVALLLCDGLRCGDIRCSGGSTQGLTSTHASPRQPGSMQAEEKETMHEHRNPGIFPLIIKESE